MYNTPTQSLNRKSEISKLKMLYRNTYQKKDEVDLQSNVTNDDQEPDSGVGVVNGHDDATDDGHVGDKTADLIPNLANIAAHHEYLAEFYVFRLQTEDIFRQSLTELMKNSDPEYEEVTDDFIDNTKNYSSMPWNAEAKNLTFYNEKIIEELKAMNEAKIDAEKKLKELEEGIELLKTANSELASERDLLASEMTTKTTSYDDLQKQLELQMMVAQELASELEEVKEEALATENDLQRRIEDLESALAALQAENGQLMKDLADSQNKLKELTDEVSSLTASNSELNNNLKVQIELVNRLNDDSSRLQADLDSSRNQGEDEKTLLQNEMKLLKEQGEAKIADLEAELNRLRAKIEDLHASLSAEKETSSDYKHQNENNISKIEELKKIIEDLNEKLKAAEEIAILF